MIQTKDSKMLANYSAWHRKSWAELSPKYAKEAYSIILTNTYLSKAYSKQFGEDWKKDI